MRPTNDYLAVVDANSGRMLGGIAVEIGTRRFGRCVVSVSRAAAACVLNRGSEATDVLVVVDLAGFRTAATIVTSGRTDRLTAAGERFVFLDRTSSTAKSLRTIGVDGRELAAVGPVDDFEAIGSGRGSSSLIEHDWLC
ncbi:hypothetical protein ACWEKT_26655 [Nocardia takedensis]